MHIRTKLLAAFAATIAVVVACDGGATNPPDLNTHFYGGVLSGANVKPTATTATATGTALASLTPAGVFGYSVTWNLLSGAVVGGAHIHGPADESNTAGVLITFGTATASGGASQTNATTASGASAGTTSALDTVHITATVTNDSLRKLLKAGLLYVDIHTTANPGGELRAQIKP